MDIVYIGILSANACVAKRLWSSISTLGLISNARKRRRIYVDTLISIIFPLIMGALMIVNAAKVYTIHPYEGCIPMQQYTWMFIPAKLLLPSIIGFISAYYEIRVLIYIYQSHQSTSRFATSPTRSFSFYRVVFLNLVYLMAICPLTIYIFVQEAKKLNFNDSWHFGPSNKLTEPYSYVKVARVVVLFAIKTIKKIRRTITGFHAQNSIGGQRGRSVSDDDGKKIVTVESEPISSKKLIKNDTITELTENFIPSKEDASTSEEIEKIATGISMDSLSDDPTIVGDKINVVVTDANLDTTQESNEQRMIKKESSFTSDYKN
ncbi:4283_t:CDS:2 [Ambispora gerdemannii]|uniref:4283_t:CDS:1 n=1 Tax=Ambispora gerdemannii TaxID=144530 RepID=A0A9N8VAB2_9GLOM|nr:4283_t:CDS:2 [Ambispora gerdemannii]